LNRQTFIQLVQNPSEISSEQAAELEKVVAGFPYCQAAHILLAKQASDTGSMLADLKLKKAAAYTADRKNLKKLLTSASDTNTEKEALQIPDDAAIATPETEVPIPEETASPYEPAPPVVQPTEAALDVQQPEQKQTPPAATSQDKLLAELQANLQRLHDLKIKIAEEKKSLQPAEEPHEEAIREEVAPVNELPPSPTLVAETEEVQHETNTAFAPTSETEPTDAYTEDKVEENKSQPSQEELPAEALPEPTAQSEQLHDKAHTEPTGIQPEPTPQAEVPATESSQTPDKQALFNHFVAPLNPAYPLRTEGIYLSVAEDDEYHTQLQQYVDYLEDKRSVFRKNKKKEEEIINKISKTELTIPKLDRNNLPDNSVDLSSKSSTISKGPISENFAKILTLQGKTDKAIEIYEQLILKIPEKKAYFEAQIEKLKNRI
jgi:tetratricopeptide (TPR) repeat protein